MSEEYTHIRVRKVTLQRLEAVRASMQLAEEMGLRELVRDNRERVSIEQVISELIYFRAKHAARRRKAAARRKARARTDRLQRDLEAEGSTKVLSADSVSEGNVMV